MKKKPKHFVLGGWPYRTVLVADQCKPSGRQIFTLRRTDFSSLYSNPRKTRALAKWLLKVADWMEDEK